MGRAVTFSDLQPNKIISGVHNAAITQGETQEMAGRIHPDSAGTAMDRHGTSGDRLLLVHDRRCMRDFCCR
jgi:hypothetical protein